MRDDKRRIALEAIAYGDNTPPEARLRAIDALRALDDEPRAPSAGDSSCPRGEAPRTLPSAPPPGIDLERGWHREEPSAVRWRPRTRPIPFLPPPS